MSRSNPRPASKTFDSREMEIAERNLSQWIQQQARESGRPLVEIVTDGVMAWKRRESVVFLLRAYLRASQVPQ